MRYFKIIFLIFITSEAYAEFEFSGIWKDTERGFYSIHQSIDSIMLVELSSQSLALSIFEQGEIKVTNESLDLAINGAGFFILELNDGSHAYTRNGKFHLSSEGVIVNARGERLVTEKQQAIPFRMSEVFDDKIDLPTCSDSDCVKKKVAKAEKRKLTVTSSGVIKIDHLQTGESIELDRVLLAAFSPLDIKSISYPIKLRSPDAATFFLPEENQFAVILQGGLEQLVYNSNTWDGYTGELEGNTALLKAISTSNNLSNEKVDFSKRIYFENDSTATLESQCPMKPIICQKFELIQKKRLSKIF